MFRQATVATTLGMRQYLRNGLFVTFLVLLPPTFIALSFIVTPDAPRAVDVPEGGQLVAVPVGMAKLHGAVMVPMTAAFLSGMLGLFVMLGSREADRRLVASGYPLALLLVVRLAIITAMSLLITLLSVGMTLTGFRPPQLGLFFLINLVSGLHYAFIGAVVGTFLSAMSGVYLMFFLPMIDLGLVQSPMVPRESIAWWMKALPGYTPTNVLVDVSFSEAFDTAGDLAVSLAYLAVLASIGMAFFWQSTAPPGRRPRPLVGARSSAASEGGRPR